MFHLDLCLISSFRGVHSWWKDCRHSIENDEAGDVDYKRSDTINTPANFTVYLQEQMASFNACYGLVLLISVVSTLFISGHSGDPDILKDFMAPNGTVVDSGFFLHRDLRNSLRGAPKDVPFKVTKASSIEFPALEGQSVSLAVLQFAPGGVNAPHTHPRSAELLLVVQGWLKVGMVDSTNKLFVQFLQAGDMFVFPKGLVHFQINLDKNYPAVAISAFGGANAGTIPLPLTLFGSRIDIDLLAKSFKTDTETIEDIVSAFAG